MRVRTLRYSLPNTMMTRDNRVTRTADNTALFFSAVMALSNGSIRQVRCLDFSENGILRWRNANSWKGSHSHSTAMALLNVFTMRETNSENSAWLKHCSNTANSLHGSCWRVLLTNSDAAVLKSSMMTLLSSSQRESDMPGAVRQKRSNLQQI